MMRKRQENGITLIALVITIIVLLILAGVAIATLTGDNSIIKKANDAKVENEKAEIKDILGIAINTIAIERGENKEYYKDKETFIEKGELDINTYAIDDYEYNLDNNLVQFKIYKKNGTKNQYKCEIDLTTGNININQDGIAKDDDKKENLEYEQQGLLVHLDGINNTGTGHKNDTETWQNIAQVENKVAENAYKVKGTSAWEENALKLDGNTYYNIKSPVNNSYGTAEVCVYIDLDMQVVNENRWYLCSTIFGCELPETQKDWAIIIDKNGNFAIGYNTATIYSSNVYALDGKIHVLSYTYTKSKIVFYVDGNKITEIQYSPSGDICPEFGIGWNRSGNISKIIGNIYSVRFYEDELTEEQIKNNYLVDYSRFNIENSKPKTALLDTENPLGYVNTYGEFTKISADNYLLKTASWYERINIPIKNLEEGKDYKLKFSIKIDNAEYGDVSAVGNLYGIRDSYIDNIPDSTLYEKELIEDLNENTYEIAFRAHSQTMYLCMTFGDLIDGKSYNIHIKNVN